MSQRILLPLDVELLNCKRLDVNKLKTVLLESDYEAMMRKMDVYLEEKKALFRQGAFKVASFDAEDHEQVTLQAISFINRFPHVFFYLFLEVGPVPTELHLLAYDPTKKDLVP